MQKVRKIPIKTRSSAGSFYSIKNNRRIEFESQLEKKIFLMIEFDYNVESYVEQPIEIESIYNNKKVKYIPDVYVLYKDKSEIIGEVKYSQELEKCDPKLMNKLKTFEDYCSFHKYKFKIYTEKDVDDIYLKNISFIMLHRTEPYKYEIIRRQIIEVILEHGEKSIKYLIKLGNENEILPVIWHLLYKRELKTDLRNELSYNSILSLNNCEMIL